MKAIEILSLCENDNIAGQEFYEQFKSYFIKRMKSIGADDIEERSYLLTARFVFDISNNFDFEDISLTIKMLQAHGRELSKVIKDSKLDSSFSGLSLNVFCDSRGLWNYSRPILHLYGFIETEAQFGLEVSLPHYTFLDITRRLDFIIPRKVLIDACAKVDEIAKAIRLVPFGG